MNKPGDGELSINLLGNKKFRILLVDDEKMLLTLAETIFDDLPVFDLKNAGSMRQAEYALSHQHFHLCFCDLGISDLNGDQYYLLKKFHRDMPFIILSGRASMECGAYCMSLGASWVSDKPDALSKEFFIKIINRFLPRSVFLYSTDSFQHTRYVEAIESLLTKKPESVEQWARLLNINERYLRKICTCCPLPLHHMVSVSHLLDLILSSDIPVKKTYKRGDMSNQKKLLEFYYLNKSSIDAFFRFGI